MLETGLITFLTFSITNYLININQIFIEYTYIIAKSACIQLFKSAFSLHILENTSELLPLQEREHCICSHSVCTTNRIWNKKCRVRLSCCVYHGINLYKQLGNKKELFPLFCLCMVHVVLGLLHDVKQLQKLISIDHHPLPYAQIRSASITC